MSKSKRKPTIYSQLRQAERPLFKVRMKGESYLTPSGVLTEEDIGTQFGGNFGGRVLDVDVGKRVFAGRECLQMENLQQMRARTGGNDA